MSTLFESQGCFLASGKKKHSVTDHNDTQSVEKNREDIVDVTYCH